MQKSDLTDLEIETKDLKLRLARPTESKVATTHQVEHLTNIPVPVQQKEQSTGQSKIPSEDFYIFKSPMVGTFYRKPSPEDSHFVSVGDLIKSGDVLCIVEAMKVMNEVQSDQSGEIIEILVEDGVSIEFGQPLFKIRN